MIYGYIRVSAGLPGLSQKFRVETASLLNFALFFTFMCINKKILYLCKLNIR